MMEIKEEKKRLAPIVQQQKEILSQFMENNEELSTGRFTSEFTKKRAQELWQEVTNLVNAVPGGSKKNWAQWRKTWQDLKKNVKAKVVANKRHATGTGGGPVKIIKIDDTEAKILNLISPKATFGDLSVPTPVTNFEYGSDGLNSGLANIETRVDEIPKVSNLESPAEYIEINDISVINQAEENTEDYLMHKRTGTFKPTPRKHTKTRRLEQSTQISEKLVKVEEEKKCALIKYYETKTNYFEWRKTYEQQKLEDAKKMHLLQTKILEEIRDIKKTVLQMSINSSL